MKKSFELFLFQAVLFACWEDELQYYIEDEDNFDWMPSSIYDEETKLPFCLYIHITYDDQCYLSMYHVFGEELAKTEPVPIDLISVCDVINFAKSRNWHKLLDLT